MSMSFGLAATLSTSQKLTPQMQQAIKLLQLSSLELAQEVQAKLDSNPLLERVEEEDEYDEFDSDSVDDYPELSTLEMWNNESTVSLAAEGSDTVESADFEFENTFSDSLDMLQQTTIDNDAIDDVAMDNDYQSSDYTSSDNQDSDYQNSVSDIDYSSFDTGSFSSGSSSSALADFDDFDSYQGSTSATIRIMYVGSLILSAYQIRIR